MRPRWPSRRSKPSNSEPSTRPTVAARRHAWERFIPFLAFPPELRKIIYTTNSIESLNYQLRRIIKNRGHFPNDDAVVKWSLTRFSGHVRCGDHAALSAAVWRVS